MSDNPIPTCGTCANYNPRDGFCELLSTNTEENDCDNSNENFPYAFMENCLTISVSDEDAIAGLSILQQVAENVGFQSIFYCSPKFACIRYQNKGESGESLNFPSGDFKPDQGSRSDN